MDCKIDSSKSTEYYELIIENGFLLYTLIELYIQHRGHIEADEEDEDMTATLEEFKKQEETSNFVPSKNNNLLKGIFYLTKDVISVGITAVKNLKGTQNITDTYNSRAAELEKEREK